MGTMARGALSDYLRHGLDVLLVGINPGLRSAELGHHFAGRNNRFWDLLFESGLTPRRLNYEEDSRLPDFGVGLTNIVARPTRSGSDLDREDFATGRKLLASKITHYAPRWVGFVGLTVYREFKSELKRAKLRCGDQNQDIDGTRIFVVPNPSGRNAHYPYGKMLDYWKELARRVGK